MNILSLDLGRHVGWALINSNDSKIVLCGQLNFTKYPIAEFYSRFKQHLDDIITSTKSDIITYEAVEFMRYRYAAQIQFGLEAIVLLVATEHDLTVVPLGVKVIKKWLTGNGNAPKRTMIKEVFKRLKENSLKYTEKFGDYILHYSSQPKGSTCEPLTALTEHVADAIACGLLCAETIKKGEQ